MGLTVDTDADEIRATRTLRESGSSTVVSIPREILRHADLTAGDDVVVSIGFETDEIGVSKCPEASPRTDADASGESANGRENSAQ